MVFHTPFNALQDLTDSEVIAELCDQIEGKQARLSPMVVPADAADEAGMFGVQWIERLGETAHAIFATPDQVAVWLDGIKLHAGGRTDGNNVTDFEMLKLRQDGHRAANAERAAQILEDIVTVVTGTRVSHLQ